ncbi:OadG family transporter subunit [Kiritimatiellota bacterium B12222]|nr:OadG family transporter subunit [Kiritimatiellota bacterium B12222]
MKRLLSFLLFLPAFCMASEQALQKIDADHGLSLAISGMIIVFGGLATISVCIALLPKALKLLEKKEKPAPVEMVPMAVDGDSLDQGTLAAIAFVLHAETERAAGANLKVTLDLHPSPWALSSQMRVLPGRIKS